MPALRVGCSSGACLRIVVVGGRFKDLLDSVSDERAAEDLGRSWRISRGFFRGLTRGSCSQLFGEYCLLFGMTSVPGTFAIVHSAWRSDSVLVAIEPEGHGVEGFIENSPASSRATNSASASGVT